MAIQMLLMYILDICVKVDCNVDVPLIHTVRGVGYVLKGVMYEN